MEDDSVRLSFCQRIFNDKKPRLALQQIGAFLFSTSRCFCVKRATLTMDSSVTDVLFGFCGGEDVAEF